MNGPPRTASSPIVYKLYLALGFVGGYGDAASFVLARAFTGHATGNIVLGAIAAAGGNFSNALSHFLAVVVFLTGVFLGAWSMRPLKPSRLSTVMAVELVLILVSPLLLSTHFAGARMFVLCVSLALGLQNGAFRRAGGISVHTTYITGMITSLVSSEAESFSSHLVRPSVPTSNPKVPLIAQIWLAFILGAISGAAATFHFKQWGMFGIAAILLGTILLYSDKEQPENN